MVSIENEAVRIRLTAPPADGKANAALVRYIATALGTTRSRVELVGGERSRRKQLLVRTGESVSCVEQRLRALTGG